MPIDLEVPNDVKEFVKELIKENDLSDSSTIEYGPGAELGEGCTSQSFTVDITDGDKSLHLFLKVPIVTWPENAPMWDMFTNEANFYGTVYPAYQSFLKEKRVTGSFRNVPKCYGIKGNFIALENLKRRNFRLLTKGETLNDEHIIFSMKTFAKFHAISYVIKDQKKELYETLKQSVKGLVGALVAAVNSDKLLAKFIQQFLENLDPVEDKDLIEASGNLVEILCEVFVNVEKHPNEFAIISQADSWSNNIMYLYKDADTTTPSDIMLVDWQMVRHGSPAIDLGYFFYTIASESTIEKYEYYLEVYHEELSKNIRQLGSDPESLYPFYVLKEEWRKYAKFGFAVGFFIIRHLLVNKEEIPKPEDCMEMLEKISNSEEVIDLNAVFPKMKNELLFQSRLKLIFRHFLKHNLLE